MKKLFTLIAFVATAITTNAQQWQLYSSGSCLSDSKWAQQCVIPAEAENTEDNTTTRFMAHYGNSCTTSTWKHQLAITKDSRNEHWLTSKNGDNSFTIASVENAAKAVMKVVWNFEDKKVYVTKATSFDVQIGAAKATTLVLPADATIPSGVKAYTLNYDGTSTLIATEVETTLPANTPVLLNAESGTYSFNFADDYVAAYTTTSPESGRYYINDVTSDENVLYGLFQPHYVPENSYVLQNGDKGVGFYKVNVANYCIHPFRCYVSLPAETSSSLRIVFPEDGVTGISTVATAADNVVYNLQGQRVDATKAGVYVKNGKKFIVK